MLNHFADIVLKLSFRFDGKELRRGDDVELTCSWPALGLTKYVTWYRKVSKDVERQMIWRYAEAFDPLTEFQDKFSHNTQSDYFSSHSIIMIDVSDEDEGIYWCELLVSGTYYETAATLKVIGG